MLQNAYFVAKIGVDTAENEPPKEWCVVADLLKSDVSWHAGETVKEAPSTSVRGARRGAHGLARRDRAGPPD